MNFISESIQTVLKPNTLIVIPCETYHQLQITGLQKDYHRCVFHFLEIPDLKDLIVHITHCTMLIEMTPTLHFLFQQMIALTEPQNESAHSFKKQMNISIHQYILKKKLATAHHKIMDGKPATQAAMECGFNDYSGFYKQFKKTYHTAPSEYKLKRLGNRTF